MDELQKDNSANQQSDMVSSKSATGNAENKLINEEENTVKRVSKRKIRKES